MEFTQADYEKLGVFFLGRQCVGDDLSPTGELLLYDSKDLTTHAVAVGMTGSGKTGLCLSLLEEAAIDRIPAIAIDPKGDIGNLLLTFPELSADEFRPWVDPAEATRRGQSVDEFAAAEADRWRKGLARWNQDGQRIRSFREQVELRIYTPGSTAGRPLSVLKSFDAPGPDIVADEELFRERIAGTAAGLLTLVGISADPIRSREQILLSMILESAWRAGQSLDLVRLIGAVQSPPFARVGALDLDTFFPAKERSSLALTLNNLLASPTFAGWLEGEPLNIKDLFHTAEGKPCVSIVSIAHLADAERMFFVTLLLQSVVAWMRGQAGTSSLRAILYMDEIYGFFPPTENPPSKRPMLTLLKQARAHGLGVVLATQNPVDLDYKGLANMGTWFLGRMQTERDKARVLDGLEGASAAAGSSFDRSQIDRILSGLGQRRFLMNNVHEARPTVFETRWALSYLRGPLTRQEIQRLEHGGPPRTDGALLAGRAAAPCETAPTPASAAPEESWDPDGSDAATVVHVPAEVVQKYALPMQGEGGTGRLVYRAALLARARLHYVRASARIDHWESVTCVRPVRGDMEAGDIWDQSEVWPAAPGLTASRPDDATLAPLPAVLGSARQFTRWRRELSDYLYRGKPLTIYECADLKLSSQPNESLGEFKVRLEVAASERRDRETERLRQKFAPKLQTLLDRRKRAEDRVEREKSQAQQHWVSTILSGGQSVLGALLGRKKLSATTMGRTATTVRSMGRAKSRQAEAARAAETLEDVQTRIEELEQEFEEAVADLNDKLHIDRLRLDELEVPPRKSDIQVDEFCVVWLPYRVDEAGIAEPAFES